MLLLRAVFSESAPSKVMSFYFYTLSIVTDIVSLARFGHNLDDSGSTEKFILAMAILLLLPKPLYAYFFWKELKDEGIDWKHGAKYVSQPSTDNKYNNQSETYNAPLTSNEHAQTGVPTLPVRNEYDNFSPGENA